MFFKREVVKQRKQWEDDYHNKAGEVIVKVMKH